MRKWFIVDELHEYKRIRGPYAYRETAIAIRDELERSASDKQNERWNLQIVEIEE